MKTKGLFRPIMLDVPIQVQMAPCLLASGKGRLPIMAGTQRERQKLTRGPSSPSRDTLKGQGPAPGRCLLKVLPLPLPPAREARLQHRCLWGHRSKPEHQACLFLMNPKWCPVITSSLCLYTHKSTSKVFFCFCFVFVFVLRGEPGVLSYKQLSDQSPEMNKQQKATHAYYIKCSQSTTH